MLLVICSCKNQELQKDSVDDHLPIDDHAELTNNVLSEPDFRLQQFIFRFTQPDSIDKLLGEYCILLRPGPGVSRDTVIIADKYDLLGQDEILSFIRDYERITHTSHILPHSADKCEIAESEDLYGFFMLDYSSQKQAGDVDFDAVILIKFRDKLDNTSVLKTTVISNSKNEFMLRSVEVFECGV